MTDRERDDFTRAHSTVLLDLESILVQIAEQDSAIDDHQVEQSLRAAIRRRPVADHRAETLTGLLGKLPEIKGVEEEVFRTAMRVIYTSLSTQSDCAPGERSYLDFATQWVRTISSASRFRSGTARLDS